MLSITRSFTFDAAHRLLGHPGKCVHLHGHTYELVVGFSKLGKLDDLGMIADFGVIKELVKNYLESWDHTLILNENDPLVSVLDGYTKLNVLDCNPTVENMIKIIAFDLMLETSKLKNDKKIDIVLQSIKLYETPDCFATFENFHEEGKNKDLFWGK